MPDLSHLKEEERKIIEDVLKRQRDEEEREQEMIRYGCEICPPYWKYWGSQWGIFVFHYLSKYGVVRIIPRLVMSTECRVTVYNYIYTFCYC
jgi:hypothetical protein